MEARQLPAKLLPRVIEAIEAAGEPSEHVDASAILTQRTYGGEQAGSKRGHAV